MEEMDHNQNDRDCDDHDCEREVWTKYGRLERRGGTTLGKGKQDGGGTAVRKRTNNKNTNFIVGDIDDPIHGASSNNSIEREECIIFTRPPSLQSIITFIALILGGMVVVYLFSNQLITMIFVGLSALLLAASFAPETQMCTLQKSKITRSHTFFPFKTPQRGNVFTTPPCSVRVREELLRYVGRGRQVVIDFDDGSELSLTSFCTLDPKESHELIANRVANFLNVDFISDDSNKLDPPGPGVAGFLENVLRDRFRPVEELG
eukprot:m.45509 g.45509  ORF g.45509 m.45509 type:complete len:262 (+) comp7225_c0_seq5:49-834(+)